MSRKELIALFKMFLEMNDALEGYLKGLHLESVPSLWKMNGGPMRDGFSGGGFIGDSYLGRAFPWIKSEEGHVYWKNINTKWVEVLKDVNNNS